MPAFSLTPAAIRDHRTCAKALKRVGARVEWWAHWRLVWALAVLAVAAFAIVAFGDWSEQAQGSPLEWLVPAIFGAGILLGGFFEWRSSRHESSLDKFYERLCIVNESREKIRVDGDPARPHVDPLEMYVFRELDNLEYLLERYRLGYLSPRLALRGVRTFYSRLDFALFPETLERLGCLADYAYQATTIAVVRKLTEAHAAQAADSARAAEAGGSTGAAAAPD